MTDTGIETDQTIGSRVDRGEDDANPWSNLEAYVALPRLTGLELAPDGRWLLATVAMLNPDQTAYTSSLWRVPTDPDAGRAVRLTRGVEGESHAAFLTDGSVVFSAKRDLPPEGPEHDSDSVKGLWCLPAAGGEAYVLARRDGGWQQVLAARDSDRIVCQIGVQRGVDDPAEDAKLRTERTKKKVAAILHEGYPVRYWDHDLGAETLRFVRAEVTGDEPRIGRDDFTVVTGDLGCGVTDEAVLSRDGSFVVVKLTAYEEAGVARSTLARIDVETGEPTIVAADPGAEFEGPVLSDDGRWLACVRDLDATADRAVRSGLWLVDLTSGAGRPLAEQWDRWPHPAAFSPDTRTLYVVADEDGESPVFAVDVATGDARRLTGHGAFSHVRLAPGGGTLFALRSAYDDPGHVVAIDTASGHLTELASPVTYPTLPGRLERVETTAADGQRVPGWLVLPEDVSAEQPARLALWIHGGPLGSWNAWSWRWCPWLLASQGWAVLLPDPALSTGYGQHMVDRGWGRWGEAPFTDLMAITDAVEQRPDIDQSRTVAMGGSFGGYMANWVAGHTDRFRAIVTHASLWNLESFGPTTDASWYWGREMSEQMRTDFSPHRFASQITTPMLVIHGDLDYRVPIGEGLALWWALNERHQGSSDDFEHRFLYFPDENHWVLKPQHAIVWYETVREFIAAHVEQRRFQRPRLL